MFNDDNKNDPIITLELPAHVAAQLEELCEQLGDEFVDGLMTDLLRATCKRIEGRLASRGALPNKNNKRRRQLRLTIKSKPERNI